MENNNNNNQTEMVPESSIDIGTNEKITDPKQAREHLLRTCDRFISERTRLQNHLELSSRLLNDTEEMERKVVGEVAMEKDPVTNKPKYSNTEMRQGETQKRLIEMSGYLTRKQCIEDEKVTIDKINANLECAKMTIRAWDVICRLPDAFPDKSL